MLSLRMLAACALLLLSIGHADVRQCICDVARPETMAARECSLCSVVEQQPPSPEFITIRDANPNKPNRLLALPRFHGPKPQHLGAMNPEQRVAYWAYSIAKAREAWGESWGLAVNSLERRTQCHMHIHIGKLLATSENSEFLVVESPAEIPSPEDLDGVWVHPVDGKLHVHRGNPTPELLLQR